MQRRWTVWGCVSVVVILLALSSSPLVGGSYARPMSIAPPLRRAVQGWANVTAPPTPPTLAGAMMAYSSAANRFVLFGGWDGEGVNQTWVYDPANRTWSQILTAVAPTTRGDAQFAYDSHADVFVLYGGWHEAENGSYLRTADTWAFSLGNGSWWERNPALAPSPRSDAAFAYDPVQDQFLLFGGFSGAVYLGDAWSYSYSNNTWSPRPSPVQPSARADGRMVYDALDGVFFLYGGNDYSDPSLNFHHLADTWEYAWTTNEWTEIPTQGSPGPRDYAVLAFDSHAGMLLQFGGYGNRTILGDTWAYDIGNRTWWQIGTDPSPPPRFAAVGGYDPRLDGFVVFGGLGNGGLRADTWILSNFTGEGKIAPSAPVDLLLLGLLVGFGIVVGALALQIPQLLVRRAKRPADPEPATQVPRRPQ